MITIDVQGHGVVTVEFTMPSSNIQPEGWLATSCAGSTMGGSSEPVGVVVEVQRRFGGLAPRALLGGVFVPDSGGEFRVDVAHGGSVRSEAGECQSSLWERPLVVGLPLEFARGVIRGLASGGGDDLPAGRLRVDHAAYDPIESSAVVFGQAASVLRAMIVAALGDLDTTAAARDVIREW